MCDSMIVSSPVTINPRMTLAQVFPNYETDRWSIDVVGDRVYYCSNDHEKHEPCEWLVLKLP